MRNILLILSCCLALCIYGEPLPVPSPAPRTFDEGDGLSHWIVSGMVQDAQGFIWLATWNGLNRYDGYEFRQVKAQPGDGSDIQSEVIRKIRMDADAGIVCHTDYDTFLFDTRTYRFSSSKPSAGRPSVEESDTRLRSHSEKVTTMRDSEGNVWHLERYGISMTPRIHHPAHVVAGTEGVQARAFMRERSGRWWLATKEDACIRIYSKQNALIGYLGADGAIHRGKTSLGYRAYCIRQTANGDVWIGCKPGALLRLRPKATGGYAIERIRHRGLTCDVIYDIAQDRRGRLWLATFGDGIICIPNPQALQPAAVNFIGRGFVKGKSKVRRIALLGERRMVCASTNGVITADISPTDIAASTFRLIQRRGSDAGSLAGNATMDVATDGRGGIFIATENNGIESTTEDSLFAPTPRFTHHGRANSALTSDACLAIAPSSGGRLLVVCSDRVVEWNPRTDYAVTYSTNFWNSSCHFSEERPLRLCDGTWLFGQEQGAYAASRHSLESRGFKPPLVFTELSVQGKPADLSIAVRDTITIGTDERAGFSITYAALAYSDNSDICYRSRINGAEWTYNGKRRSLTFYNMQQGTYRLEVQSTDPYGRWVDNTASIVIIVKPHWYETLWARLLGILLLTGVITAVVYTVFYVRQLRKARAELLQKYLALLAPDGQEAQAAAAVAPDERTGTLAVSPSDQRFLDKVRIYIEENIGNDAANIDDMAAFSAVSRSTLNRKLRSLVGITATQLLIDARMQSAKKLLEKQKDAGTQDISEIAYRCGYSDPRYFSKAFKQKYGASPTEFLSS